MQLASRSGDMRRLLDACAAAVDLVVQEASEPQPEQASGEPLLARIWQACGMLSVCL